MNNLFTIYPYSVNCSRNFEKTDRISREGEENNPRWKSEKDDDDCELTRENFALLGFTNYLPPESTTRTRFHDHGPLHMRHVREGLVEMIPFSQSCINRMTARPAPKLLDAIKWSTQQYPRIDGEDFNVCTETSVDVHREEDLNLTETNDDKLKTDYCEKNASLDNYVKENLALDPNDDNVSLWDLRKNLERNTVICLSEAANDTKSSHAINNEGTRRSENASSHQTDDSSDCTKSDKKENHSSVLTRNDADAADKKKSPAKKERNIRHIRKYCKWYFKSCQDAVFDDDQLDKLEDNKDARLSDTKGFTSANGNSRSDGSCQLSVPGEEHLRENDQSTIMADSSSCSVTPDSISSDSTQRQYDCIGTEDNITSNETSEKSSKSEQTGSIQNITRIFRRSSPKHRVSSPSFCGYSLERDYCVDLTTDRIFKEFLKPNPGETPTFAKRTPLLRNKTTQLRRQLMRKQYSDSAAVYYGQRMRRWRVKKQRSDSVNCPVDRAVLRRQDKINEEYYPDELQNDIE